MDSIVIISKLLITPSDPHKICILCSLYIRLEKIYILFINHEPYLPHPPATHHTHMHRTKVLFK